MWVQSKRLRLSLFTFLHSTNFTVDKIPSHFSNGATSNSTLSTSRSIFISAASGFPMRLSTFRITGVVPLSKVMTHVKGYSVGNIRTEKEKTNEMESHGSCMVSSVNMISKKGVICSFVKLFFMFRRSLSDITQKRTPLYFFSSSEKSKRSQTQFIRNFRKVNSYNLYKTFVKINK